ncbi:hypothetical protein AVEN_105665-1 [Araneus ventricosus]|uniref:Integrase zinc-binding domain-containing protein n=1 Tax=Araneus ventricosus TaxID=182803 RepID=A0A4Y1ZUI0_ARAVE|nr:hypothetical protein AVEN_105665-1 [Araneus ventricosus]
MNQGVLYRYSHDSESEEAQLVVPSHERDKILKEHHDSPNAAHYGLDGTYQRIANCYFWIENFAQSTRFKMTYEVFVTLKDTFLQEIIPYLKGFSKFMADAKEVAEMMKSDATRFAQGMW